MTVNYLFISGGADVEELPYPKLKSTILKLCRKEIIQILITLPFTHVVFFSSEVFLLGLITIHIAVGDFV